MEIVSALPFPYPSGAKVCLSSTGPRRTSSPARLYGAPRPRSVKGSDRRIWRGVGIYALAAEGEKSDRPWRGDHRRNYYAGADAPT